MIRLSRFLCVGLLFMVACLRVNTVQADEPMHREVVLQLPENIRDLPKLPSTRHIIHRPRGDGDNTYHHNAMIEFWKGRFFVAWNSSPQSEATRPQGGLISTSVDGENWSPAVQPTGWEEMIPRGWNKTDDALYMWGGEAVFKTVDGKSWERLPPEALRQVDSSILATSSNKRFDHLSDGRLMAWGVGDGGVPQFPITSDQTGLSGWDLNRIDPGGCPDVGEPGGYEGPDGALHGCIRYGPRIWHTYSLDQGKTWDRLREQKQFPDSPGNKEFGRFPDGSVWCVLNPVPGSRMELLLAHSRDGWSFDDNYLVRWEQIEPVWWSKFKSEDRPGWEYPGALYKDGILYVVYSRTRDWIEVSKVDVTGLLQQGKQSAVKGP